MERDKLKRLNANATEDVMKMLEDYAENLSKDDKHYGRLTVDDIAPIKIKSRADIPIVRVANEPYLVLRIVFDCRLINDFATIIQFQLP